MAGAGTRRKSRELALQCLYQWDQQRHEASLDIAEEVMDQIEADPDSRPHARSILAAYWARPAEIDAWIDASSDNWRISRMAVIDRNVLRIAATELRWIEDIPPRVAIDEAIEIVRRFSTEKSATFVNGILDRLLKDAEQEDGSR
ncbi:MAG: transcription antitermination factor NusB [Planctomycetota bacterium]|nr:transcription antitermination factor NusB [Planctomycetota bacterium]MEE2890101.1 transcription antitermination factor NusB [Planctomycetota bacterium]